MHTPVMVEEILRYLLHDGSSLVLDATVGCGGHARAILDANTSVELIGVDRDGEALEQAREVLAPYKSRVRLVRASYVDLDRTLEGRKVDGALLDLGISSLQLDRPQRGFAYSREGPLDMRMSDEGQTARSLIERVDVTGLSDVLKCYGEVTGASKIARAIRTAVDKDSMATTFDLKNAVDTAFGGKAPPSVLSKVFQAIRIAVNHETENVQGFLDAAPRYVRQDSRLVFVAYHSLEDRLIKDFLKRESTDCLCPPKVPTCVCGHEASLEVLTRRVVKPLPEEIRKNPRARSARLRAARVISSGGDR